MQLDRKENSDKTEFGLQRVLCFVWEIIGKHVLAYLNNLGTLYLLLSIHIQIIHEL